MRRKKKIIAISGFSSEEEDEIRKKIQTLNGEFSPSINGNVDYLISKNVLREKYRYAVSIDIPIVTSKWIDKCLQERKFWTHQNYELSALKGCVITCSQVREGQKDHICRLVDRHMGQYSEHLDAGVTHVIAGEPNYKDMTIQNYHPKYRISMKCVQAIKRNIPIVTQKWLKDTDRMKQCQDESSYRPLFWMEANSAVKSDITTTKSEPIEQIPSSSESSSQDEVPPPPLQINASPNFKATNSTSGFLLNKPLPPPYFMNDFFYLCGFPEALEDDKLLAVRIINHFGGLIASWLTPRITIVVCYRPNDKEMEETKKVVYPLVRYVNFAWLKKCYQFNRFVPITKSDDFHVTGIRLNPGSDPFLNQKHGIRDGLDFFFEYMFLVDKRLDAEDSKECKECIEKYGGELVENSENPTNTTKIVIRICPRVLSRGEGSLGYRNYTKNWLHDCDTRKVFVNTNESLYKDRPFLKFHYEPLFLSENLGRPEITNNNEEIEEEENMFMEMVKRSWGRLNICQIGYNEKGEEIVEIIILAFKMGKFCRTKNMFDSKIKYDFVVAQNKACLRKRCREVTKKLLSNGTKYFVHAKYIHECANVGSVVPDMHNFLISIPRDVLEELKDVNKGGGGVILSSSSEDEEEDILVPPPPEEDQKVKNNINMCLAPPTQTQSIQNQALKPPSMTTQFGGSGISSSNDGLTQVLKETQTQIGLFTQFPIKKKKKKKKKKSSYSVPKKKKDEEEVEGEDEEEEEGEEEEELFGDRKKFPKTQLFSTTEVKNIRKFSFVLDQGSVKKLKGMIDSLGEGECVNFNLNETTHLIVDKEIEKAMNNKKLLQSLARGIWVLTEQFVVESYENRNYVRENNFIIEGVTRMKNTKNPRFLGWVVYISDLGCRRKYESIYEAGRAKVVGEMSEEVTHVIVRSSEDGLREGNGEDPKIEKIGEDVKVLISSFIFDYLKNPSESVLDQNLASMNSVNTQGDGTENILRKPIKRRKEQAGGSAKSRNSTGGSSWGTGRRTYKRRKRN